MKFNELVQDILTEGKKKAKSKPDYLDFDKDGNKKESMKKALKDKGHGKKHKKGMSSKQAKFFGKKSVKEGYGEMEENHDEMDMSNPKERTEVHIAKEILNACNTNNMGSIKKLANELLKMHGV